MLVVMIGIRKSLDCLFTRRELKILDDIMPDILRRDAVDDMNNLDEGEVSQFVSQKLFFKIKIKSMCHTLTNDNPSIPNKSRTNPLHIQAN